MAIKVATPEEWRAARIALLAKEKEFTRAKDALTKQRQALPAVEVDKAYEFTKPGPNGSSTKLSLKELFAGRRQLIVYHFMFDPANETGCPNCAFLVDNIGNLSHLNSRNTTFVLVSRAPSDKIEKFKARMGWPFDWYSSYNSSFNYDFHVTQDTNIAPIEYNYKSADELAKMPWFTRGEQPGLSSFYLNDDGKVYHTYSTYARGPDSLLTTYNLLDMTLLGRQDDMSDEAWPFHDEY